MARAKVSKEVLAQQARDAAAWYEDRIKDISIDGLLHFCREQYKQGHFFSADLLVKELARKMKARCNEEIEAERERSGASMFPVEDASSIS